MAAIEKQNRFLSIFSRFYRSKPNQYGNNKNQYNHLGNQSNQNPTSYPRCSYYRQNQYNQPPQRSYLQCSYPQCSYPQCSYPQCSFNQYNYPPQWSHSQENNYTPHHTQKSEEGSAGFTNDPNHMNVFVDACLGEEEGGKSQCFMGGVYVGNSGCFSYFARQGPPTNNRNTFLAEQKAVSYGFEGSKNFSQKLVNAYDDHVGVVNSLQRSNLKKDGANIVYLPKYNKELSVFRKISHVLALLAKLGILLTDYTVIAPEYRSPRSLLNYLHSLVPLSHSHWKGPESFSEFKKLLVWSSDTWLMKTAEQMVNSTLPRGLQKAVKKELAARGMASHQDAPSTLIQDEPSSAEKNVGAALLATDEVEFVEKKLEIIVNEPEKAPCMQMSDARCQEKKGGLTNTMQEGARGDYDLQSTLCSSQEADLSTVETDKSSSTGKCVGAAPLARNKFEALEQKLVGPQPSPDETPGVY